MSKILPAALAVALLSAGASVAQTPEPAPAPTPAARPTIDSSIEALEMNPATKAVMDRHMPGIAEHPAYPQFKGMTLAQVAPYSQGHITPEMIATIDAELKALPAD